MGGQIKSCTAHTCADTPTPPPTALVNASGFVANETGDAPATLQLGFRSFSSSVLDEFSGTAFESRGPLSSCEACSLRQRFRRRGQGRAWPLAVRRRFARGWQTGKQIPSHESNTQAQQANVNCVHDTVYTARREQTKSFTPHTNLVNVHFVRDVVEDGIVLDVNGFSKGQIVDVQSLRATAAPRG